MKLVIDGLFGMGISFKLDGFRIIFCSLTIIMWIIAMEFSKDYFKKGYTDEITGKEDGGASGFVFFSVLVLVAALGMVLSNDMLSAFIFFEVMSLGSYPWVAHFGTAKDMRAAASYLTYAVLGGLATLTGILLLARHTGTLYYDELYKLGMTMGHDDKFKLFVPCLLIIFGYAAKAGMFPLHTWLAPSYTAAPAPAAALLSAVLSKTGIIGMIVVCAGIMRGLYEWGMMILVLGIITMLVGGLWAMLSVDAKKVIAYSSMSQIGYIIVALGVFCILGGSVSGVDCNALAPEGVFLHMINHSVYKMIFFIIIGIISMECGRNLDINKIKGWGYDKIFLKIVFTIAVLGISGVPFLSGYVSKTLIHEGILEYLTLIQSGMAQGSASFVRTLEILFLIGGGCTFAYMLKIYIPVFWCKPKQDDRDAKIVVEVVKADNELKPNDEKADGDKATGKLSVFVYIMLGLLAVFVVVCGAVPHVALEKLGNEGMSFFGAASLKDFAYFSWDNLKGAGISLAIGVFLYVAIARNVRKRIIPAWFSLEKMLYKPILFGILPTICTFFMRICDWCIEGPVYLIRKTILKDNSTVQKPRKKHIKFHEFMATGNLLARSVSFGLIMFATAFLATIIYLLFAMLG
ncbi:MAG: complex I subunit 5 family protein [Clostridium sp.]|nr:complex I subunit 5 family protein [Clostridium sp.]MCM1171323.1 complex I subunit 5 family protein [Clostridium sp.]